MSRRYDLRRVRRQNSAMPDPNDCLRHSATWRRAEALTSGAREEAEVRKLLAVYLGLAVMVCWLLSLLLVWARTGIAIGGGTLLVVFVLYISRHSE